MAKQFLFLINYCTCNLISLSALLQARFKKHICVSTRNAMHSVCVEASFVNYVFRGHIQNVTHSSKSCTQLQLVSTATPCKVAHSYAQFEIIVHSCNQLTVATTHRSVEATLASVSINTSLMFFRFLVSSTSRVNLTVSVEDEYTFFSPDKPLVSGATVQLISSFTQETFTLITNTSGIFTK